MTGLEWAGLQAHKRRQMCSCDVRESLADCADLDATLNAFLAATSTVCHIWCSLNKDSIAALIRAFVASRVHYCVGLLAGAPGKLQHAVNVAARVISNGGKYDRGLTQFQRHFLRWLVVVEWIRFTQSLGLGLVPCGLVNVAGLWQSKVYADIHGDSLGMGCQVAVG